MDKTYEIIDGVRRSKAAQMAGHQTIPARLYTKDAAKLIREFEVPIAHLQTFRTTPFICVNIQR